MMVVGRALWYYSVKFNYEINDDIPHLKRRFYNTLIFLQKPEINFNV